MEHLSKFGDIIKYSSVSFPDIPMIKDSMVYIDPPYINTEAGYNSYWSKELEINLYEYVKQIDNHGNSFMISGVLNHDGKESETLFKLSNQFKMIELDYNYNKVSKNKNDKKTQEVIIVNY